MEMIEVPLGALEQIRELYNRGKYLQAYEFSKRFGPFASWKNTDARLLAGRMAHHLGASGLANRLIFQCYRHDRTHPETRFFFNCALLEFRGPLAAWNWNKNLGELAELDANLRSDFFALRGRCAALLRDFETAELWMRQAETLCPDKPWLHVERAYLLEAEDRYEDALASAQRSLAGNAWYRPGVQIVAHILQLLSRDEEAADLLREASHHIESSAILAQLATIELELKRYGEARNTLERCSAAAPLMEEQLAEWLNASRADVAYHCGNFLEAIEFARKVDSPFYKAFLERFEKSSGKGRRVQHSVGFVRQHHMTCAPATLSAIGRFWGKSAEHLAVAETICYDGTPAHSERSWAEENGWATREFKVTQESAEALLERGIPFTLTTVEPGSAHLQAVIGFDELRACLIIRDPYLRYSRELQTEKGLEHYAASGPRGMAMVPIEKAQLLEGLQLPEADLYDQLYRIQKALAKHDREKAQAEFAEMKATAPDHRLTLQAHRAMAGYDANLTEQLAAVEKLLLQFPKDANLQLSRLNCLRDLAARSKRSELLKTLCAEKDSSPLLWLECAAELHQDAREHEAANRLLTRYERARRQDAYATYLRANQLWEKRQFAEATELYRFAASLEDKKEFYAMAYFNATRHLKQTPRAIAYLKARFERLGKLSHFPALTLFRAYSEIDQTTLAFEMLEQALALRPDDAELLLFAADAFARYGNFVRADALLQNADGKSQKAHWLRTAASLKTYRGQLFDALRLWQQVLELEPLALDANRHVTQLLGETKGRAAALQHLEQICARFPHNFALHNLRYDWLREDGADVAEPALRKLIEIDSINAWAHRELALLLGRSQKFDAAFAEAELALRLDRSNAAGFNVRGWLQQMKGNRLEAKADFQKAIALSVDFGDAMNGLIQCCDSLAEKKEAVNFITDELVRQVVFGDGLLAFRDIARPILEPEELLALLRKGLAERPDLWHAWSAVFLQLADMNQLEEALKLAREATERFPLLPRVWMDLAEVHRARLEMPGEIAALEKAVEINSSWGYAVRCLASAYERAGQMQKARSILEESVARSPLDPFGHGCLAEILWKLGEKTTALQRLQLALRLDGSYDWAWSALRNWARELDQKELPAKIARELTAVRSGEANIWLQLARAFDAQKDSAEMFSCIERALTLEPRSVPAWQAKAIAFVDTQRFEEAKAACHPAVFGEKVPSLLRARSAWITKEQGDLRAAIAQMKTVLAEDPGLYWGWKELADWHWMNGSHGDAVAAAAKLSRLAPLDPLPLGYSGDMKRHLEDRKGAKADFKRAMELAPDYLFAGFSLFELQMDDGEFEAARDTLKRLRGHATDDQLLSREIQIRIQKRERGPALEALQKLCASTEADEAPLRNAVLTLCSAGWQKETEKVLDEKLFSPGTNLNVGVAWVECRLHGGKRFCLRKLNRLQAIGEIGRRAIIRYVEALGEICFEFSNKRDFFVPLQCRFLSRMILRKHSGWLRAEDWSWGKVGYALVSQNRMKAAAQWLSDWKQRPNAESWMLYNLIVALHARNRDEEAFEVCRHAASLRCEQGTQESFRACLAVEEALAGNTAVAAEHCAGLNAAKLTGRNKYLHGLAQAMLKVQMAPQTERRAAFKEARQVLDETFSGISIFDTGKSMRRFYRRAVRRIAEDSGGVWPKLWGWSQHCNRAAILVGGLVAGVFAAVINPDFWPLLFFYSVGIFVYLRFKN